MLWRLGFAVSLALGVCACSRRATSDSPPRSLTPSVTPSTSAEPAPTVASSAPLPLPAPPAATRRPWPPRPPDARSDFCIEGVDALDASTCYVLPEAPPEELLIYLHGIVPPAKNSRQKTNFETVVQAASRRANVAALMPRGRRGLAPQGHDGWWGWPTSRGSYLALASELIAEMNDKRRNLEALIGRPFARVYLAGSSSGAYFVTALAAEGALSVDGYGIISGAVDRPDVEWTKLPRTPVYIGFGTQDTVGASARALGARLARAGFPVQVAVHPLPHGTAEVYLNEAFAHFRARQSR